MPRSARECRRAPHAAAAASAVARRQRVNYTQRRGVRQLQRGRAPKGVGVTSSKDCHQSETAFCPSARRFGCRRARTWPASIRGAAALRRPPPPMAENVVESTGKVKRRSEFITPSMRVPAARRSSSRATARLLRNWVTGPPARRRAPLRPSPPWPSCSTTRNARRRTPTRAWCGPRTGARPRWASRASIRFAASAAAVAFAPATGAAQPARCCWRTTSRAGCASPRWWTVAAARRRCCAPRLRVALGLRSSPAQTAPRTRRRARTLTWRWTV
jgi:hypothetical protein